MSRGAPGPPRLRLGTAVAAIVLAAVGAACSPDPETEVLRPRTVADALRQVSLQHTTAQDIEQTFGKADARTPDGGLVYHFERDHGRARETEAVTFRFSRGVLTKICRVRSAT